MFDPTVNRPRLYPAISNVAGMFTPTVPPLKVMSPPPTLAGFGDAVPDNDHDRSL